MEHIMSTKKKSMKIVAVTRLKECNSILNLQPPVAGKYLCLTIIHAMVFLTPLQPLNTSIWQYLANYSHHLKGGQLRNADLSGRKIPWASGTFMWDYRHETHLILINKKMGKPFVTFNCWCQRHKKSVSQTSIVNMFYRVPELISLTRNIYSLNWSTESKGVSSNRGICRRKTKSSYFSHLHIDFSFSQLVLFLMNMQSLLMLQHFPGKCLFNTEWLLACTIGSCAGLSTMLRISNSQSYLKAQSSAWQTWV